MEKRAVPIRLNLDIDQTLAGGVVEAHMRLYNRRLGLNMSELAILAARQYAKTFDVPEIIGYRNPEDATLTEEREANFQATRAEIRTSPEVHLDLQSLPGSKAGVETLLTTLAQVQDVSYYTVRPTEVEEATKEWLRRHDYPNPEQVVICSSPEDKLRKIIEHQVFFLAEEDRGPVILVDDSLKELLQAADVVGQDAAYREGLKYIVLIGFGDTQHLEGTFYPTTGLRVLSLPSWKQQHLEDVVARI